MVARRIRRATGLLAACAAATTITVLTVGGAPAVAHWNQYPSGCTGVNGG